MTDLCSEGCGRVVWARGFCASHYSSARYANKLADAPRVRNEWGSGTFSVTTGYRYVTVEGRRVAEHIAVAEAALGRRLPEGAQVHHLNENRVDNRPGNLVVCPDQSYHQLLHLRSEAMDRCGNPDARKCTYCKQWDAPENLRFVSAGTKAKTPSPKIYHPECRSADRRKKHAEKTPEQRRLSRGGGVAA